MRAHRRALLSLGRVPAKWWSVLAVAIGPVALFAPGMIAGRVLFWGTPILQFAPWRSLGLSDVLSGHLPLWNPLVGLGAPLLANYQSALLYPPNWIQALVGVAWGQALLVAAHLVWAGTGMAYLSRRLGLSWLAGAVAAIAFSLSGYLVARSGFLSINASVAWLPWILAAVDRLVSKDNGSDSSGQDRWAFGVAVGCFTCQWLAGHAQVAWYSLLLAVVWAAWRAPKRLGPSRGWFGLAGRMAAALGLSFCLAAPQLLPTLEFMLHSQRATAVGRDVAMTYSLWPWRLSGLLAPNLFGSPVTGDYWGYGNFWEDALYIGVVPLCLALFALVRGVRGKSKRAGDTLFLGGISLVSLVIALGKNTPVFPFLYDHVPTFSLFQAPTRWTLWLVLALSLLAGLGVDEWGVAKGRGLYWLRLGTAGAVAVALGAGLASVALRDVHATFIAATVLSGVWLAATGALALTRRDRPGSFWKSTVVGVVVIDLTLAGVGLNPLGPPSLYSPASGLASRLPQGSRIYMAPDVEYRFKYETMFRFDRFDPAIDFGLVPEAGLPNTPVSSGLATVNNFDPILPARYPSWMNVLADMPAEQKSVWLDAMDVGLAATTIDATGVPVFEDRTPTGRAWIVGGELDAGSAADALAAVSRRGFDPLSQVVIEGSSTGLAGPGKATGTIVVNKSTNPNRVSLVSNSQTGGWVVISAMTYPGWGASLDGEPVDLYPADYVFSAVRVPAGEHEINLVYHCLPFELGLLLALGGVGILAAWVVKMRRGI